MQIHATAADLIEGPAPWLTTVPDNLGALLRSASALVDAEIAGNPSADPVVLRDATCAQVTAWATAGIDPASGGLSATAPIKAKSVDTARLEFDNSRSASAVAFQARQSIAGELCPVAVAILEAADLIGVFAIADGGPTVPEATEPPSGWWQC